MIVSSRLVRRRAVPRGARPDVASRGAACWRWLDRLPGLDPGGLPVRAVQQLRRLQFLRLLQAGDQPHPPSRSGCCGSGAVGGCRGRIWRPVDRRRPGDDRRADVRRRVRHRARSPRPCRCPTLRPTLDARPEGAGPFRYPTAAARPPAPGPGRAATSRGRRRSKTRRPARLGPSTRPESALGVRPVRERGGTTRRSPATTTIRSTICRPWGCPAR